MIFSKVMKSTFKKVCSNISKQLIPISGILLHKFSISTSIYRLPPQAAINEGMADESQASAT